jgi:hypothetical protein
MNKIILSWIVLCSYPRKKSAFIALILTCVHLILISIADWLISDMQNGGKFLQYSSPKYYSLLFRKMQWSKLENGTINYYTVA